MKDDDVEKVSIIINAMEVHMVPPWNLPTGEVCVVVFVHFSRIPAH